MESGTGGNLRTIAESAPEQLIDTGRFQFNAGKINTFGLTWAEPGARRKALEAFLRKSPTPSARKAAEALL